MGGETLAKSEPEFVLERPNTLGESVIWQDRKAALYWVDMHGKDLWRRQPLGETEPVTFPLLERPGVIGLRQTDGGVLALESGFALFHDSAASLETNR
jgi:L-arabinonolactonase